VPHIDIAALGDEITGGGGSGASRTAEMRWCDAPAAAIIAHEADDDHREMRMER
jgi:hypothetical protein